MALNSWYGAQPYGGQQDLLIAAAPAAAAAQGQRDVAQIRAGSAAAQRAMEKAQFDWKLDAWNRMFLQQKQQVGGLTGMIDQYNQAFQQAKTANEQKYQEALGVVGTNTGQQRSDVMRQYQGQRASAMQQLARVGMANTTIAPTLQAGIQREQQGALNRVSDQAMQARLGVMQGFEYKFPEPGITQAAIGAMAPRFQFPSF